MKHPKTILIVDDEMQSRTLIRKMLTGIHSGLTISEADSVNDALKKIGQSPPDIVFLDVQMRGETGFDLLDKVSSPGFAVIFTTAHSEFALKAFRYSAMDYLMKPLDEGEFRLAVEKAFETMEVRKKTSPQQIQFFQQQLKSPAVIPEKITIPTVEGILFVTISDILYCHALNNYTEFYLSGTQKITSSYTLGYYTEWLTAHGFFRVHRSYLVNLAHIKMYKRGDGGTIIMNDGEEIEVSRNNKGAFLQLFKERN